MGNIESALVWAGYATCLLLIPYWLLVAHHRLYVHPLKNYPGPLLARLSDVYAGYHALRRSLHLVTREDHQRYGDVMRYGPNRLVFNTVPAIRDIYQNPRVTKSHVYLFSLSSSISPPFIFNTLDNVLHARKRKIINPALSERSMRGFQPVMLERINVFLKLVLENSEQPINMTERCKRLAMDVAVRLGFGYPLEFQTSKEHDFVFQGISIANLRINAYMNFPSLSKLNLNIILKNTPMRAKWYNLVETMVKSRLSESKDAKKDFYSFVMGNLEAGTENIKNSELFQESLFFLSAGGDTVTTTMAAIFYYLSRHPGCYARLAEEIRTIFTTGGEIRHQPQLARCKYLRACIDETLRVSPPVGGTLWRELAANEHQNEPFVVDGHVIPPGTMVGVNVYSIHHNEKYFPDPFSFKPERWLEDGPSGINGDSLAHPAESGKNRAFAPFSIGSRSCVGKSMAYMEISLLIAKTLWYFDFEKVPGKVGEIGSARRDIGEGVVRDEFRVYDALTSRHDGPYLKFTPRGNFCDELSVPYLLH